jgi:hypothetical protein
MSKETAKNRGDFAMPNLEELSFEHLSQLAFGACSEVLRRQKEVSDALESMAEAIRPDENGNIVPKSRPRGKWTVKYAVLEACHRAKAPLTREEITASLNKDFGVDSSEESVYSGGIYKLMGEELLKSVEGGYEITKKGIKEAEDHAKELAEKE